MTGRKNNSTTWEGGALWPNPPYTQPLQPPPEEEFFSPLEITERPGRGDLTQIYGSGFEFNEESGLGLMKWLNIPHFNKARTGFRLAQLPAWRASQ